MKILRIANIQTKNSKTNIPKLNRYKLKADTSLKILNGAGSKEISQIMIIPGGLNKWERLYYASTGNFPESVTNRWFEKGLDGNIIKEGDYEIKIGTHLSNDPDYDLHEVNSAEYTHANIDVDNSDIPNSDSDSKNLIDYIIDSISEVL